MDRTECAPTHQWSVAERADDGPVRSVLITSPCECGRDHRWAKVARVDDAVVTFQFA
jgi:hypothetical protein